MSRVNEGCIFLEDFINMYKSFPCLWNTKCKDYKNHLLRKEAFNALSIKCRELDPIADRDYVSKKIHNLRCSFRRELRRIKKNPDYHPTLWYFDQISFIAQAEEYKESDEENDLDKFYGIVGNEDLYGNNPDLSNDFASSSNSPYDRNLEKRRKIHEVKEDLTDPVIVSISEGSKFLQDQFEVAGKKIAYDLQNMESRQRIIAEKLINDVIYYAKMDMLNETSTIQHSQRVEHFSIKTE